MNDLRQMFNENNEMSQKIEEELRASNRRSGIKLDLLKLTGGLTSLVPNTKDKKDKNTPVQKWLWSSFYNPARDDKVEFYHWQKLEHVKDDYEYSKLNTKINIVNLREDEYNEVCSDLDPAWTWEETKYFWDLCREFDLRFIIIHDRYNFAERTIEELKDRYYSVCRRILENRRQYDHPILKSGYSYEQEIKRRACLERIINKSQDFANLEKELIEQSLENKAKIEKIKMFDNLEKKIANQVQDEGELGDFCFEEYIKSKPYTDGTYAFLRSYKMTHPIPINEKFQKKIELILKELSVPDKLVPTERVDYLFDKVKNNIIVYSSLKKHLEKKEKERKNLELIFENNSKPTSRGGHYNVPGVPKGHYNAAVYQGGINPKVQEMRTQSSNINLSEQAGKVTNPNEGNLSNNMNNVNIGNGKKNRNQTEDSSRQRKQYTKKHANNNNTSNEVSMIEAGPNKTNLVDSRENSKKKRKYNKGNFPDDQKSVMKEDNDDVNFLNKKRKGGSNEVLNQGETPQRKKQKKQKNDDTQADYNIFGSNNLNQSYYS